MYGLSTSGMVPGLRPVAPAPAQGPAPTRTTYGDYYCSDCEVQWSKMESHYCWSCGADLDPVEEE